MFSLRPRSPRRPRLLALGLLAGLAGLAAAPVSAEEIEITGRVTDPAGKPLAGVAIQFKASHGTVSLRRMSRVETHPTYVSTLTDEKGGFQISWQRHEFYDQFSVAAGLRVPTAEEGFEELLRVDVTRRAKDPGGIIVPLEVERTPRLEAYLAFFATIESEDQLKVFEQVGQPDKTDQLQVAGQEEVTWWYFRRGKAYRFADGRLEIVIPFEPTES